MDITDPLIVVQASVNKLQCIFYIHEDLGDADGTVFTRGNFCKNNAFGKLSDTAKEVLPSILNLPGVAWIYVFRYHFVVQRGETYFFESLASRVVGTLLAMLAGAQSGDILSDSRVEYRHFKPLLSATRLSVLFTENAIAEIKH